MSRSPKAKGVGGASEMVGGQGSRGGRVSIGVRTNYTGKGYGGKGKEGNIQGA